MSRILSAYEPSNDFPVWDEEPLLRYAIAATPRTGSTFLALELWRTGVLGAPMEYLNLKHSTAMRERLAGGSDEQFWRELKRVRTSPNGVFGIKLFPGNYVRMARDAPSILKDIWFHKIIFISRRNKVQQAISHYKAHVGGSWYSRTPEKRPVEYDLRGITRFYTASLRNEERWTKAFNLMGVDPFIITYEDFIANPVQGVRAIMEYLGVSPANNEMPGVITTEIQRDAISEEWASRFVDDIRRFRAAEGVGKADRSRINETAEGLG